MIKEKINALLKSKNLKNIDGFVDLLENANLTKRYSIVKECRPYLLGDNIYQINFCFFFYYKDWLSKTFYCSIEGLGISLNNEKIISHEYQCNDTNRADCWEWVDVD